MITRHPVDFWIKNNFMNVSIKDIDGDVAAHWHEFYEIEVILEGAGNYRIDGVDYAIGEGCLFFMSPSSFHEIRFTENTRLMNIMFTLEACDANFLYDLFDVTPHIAMHISGEDLHFFHILIAEMVRTRSLPYLSSMLHCVLGKIRSLRGTEEPPIKNSAMQNAVLYMQNHFREEIRLSDAAKIANYSTNYFGNKFKEYTGVTFQAYLLNLKFALVEKLLTDTALSVTEICYQCGFHDFSNFMSYFKKRYGMTPKEYRGMKR